MTKEKNQEIEIFESNDGQISFDVNIFREGELVEEIVCRNFRRNTQHGSIKGKIQATSIFVLLVAALALFSING